MFDTIKNFFSKRADLFKERSEVEATFKEHDAAYSREIERLETKPHTSIREREQIAKTLLEVKYKKSLASAHYQLKRDQINARLRASVPAVDEKIHGLWGEFDFTRQQKKVSGSVDKTGRYGPTLAHLDSNAARIDSRLTAIREAIAKLESPKLQPVDNIRAEIQKIVDEIPPLDVSTERIGCGAGIAAGLEYPPPARI